jgi:hypothetical protein
MHVIVAKENTLLGMKLKLAKENTLLGMKLKLAGIIWVQIWPTCTSKDSKRKVIWCLVKEALKRGLTMNDLARKPINQIGGSDKCLIPKFERHRCMSKQG